MKGSIRVKDKMGREYLINPDQAHYIILTEKSVIFHFAKDQELHWDLSDLADGEFEKFTQWFHPKATVEAL